MTFAQWRNRLTTHFSEGIPVVNLRTTPYYLHLSVRFPVVHRLLVFSRHIWPFTTSPDVKFLCFRTLSISFSHFTSGRPRRHILPGDQIIILLGHLWSSVRFLQNCLCYSIFFLITELLSFSILEVLTAPLQKLYLYLYLIAFVTSNPMSKFPNRHWVCFLSLYKILVSLYLRPYIYSKVGQVVLVLLSRLAEFCMHYCTDTGDFRGGKAAGAWSW